jgi:hypothetical protein
LGLIGLTPLGTVRLPMLQDHEIVKAVSRIRQRAERQEEADKLVAVYVDSGILPQLANENHQILYGRRGTGKTHLLRVLANKMEHDAIPVVYIDCRTLGSSSEFSDSSYPVSRRCLALFRDILAPVYNRLLEQIIERQPPGGSKALDAADALQKAIVNPVERYETKEVEFTEDRETSENRLSRRVSNLSGRCSEREARFQRVKREVKN